jgi:vacuolar protein sorting-associated protein 13A/C
LHVNLSDTKYKALMRLIDTCIPKFNDDDHETNPPIAPPSNYLPTFQLPVTLFGATSLDLGLEEQDQDEPDEAASSPTDTFFEAQENLQVLRPIHVFPAPNY